MFVIEGVLLLALCAVTAYLIILGLRMMRGEHRGRLLTLRRGVLCDSRAGVGISVLCVGNCTLEQISNLLDVEYARYEVLVVIDAQRWPVLFRTLAVTYAMIRVDFQRSAELPVAGVRGLYRSRSRRFRRLVLMDRATTTLADDLDAAAGVAVYDYLLPVENSHHLMIGAIERLAAEISVFPEGQIKEVRSRFGAPVTAFARREVMAAGGFTADLQREIPAVACHTLYIPLLRQLSGESVVFRRLFTGAVWLMGGVGLLVLFHGKLMVSALLLTVVLVWCVLALIQIPAVDRKKSTRNFTIS
ncbi:MAG: hypothetical protein RR330_06570 [Alistipes sp.]